MKLVWVADAELTPLISLTRIASQLPASATYGEGLTGPGRSQESGYVQVYYEGAWRYACPFNWEQHEAQVVCRQLGLAGGIARSYAVEGYYRGYYGQWVMHNAACSGVDSALLRACTLALTSISHEASGV